MTTSIRRTLAAAATATLTVAALSVGVAAASAHVHVDPDDTAAGGYTHLTFSVPNESATAKTTRLEVKLPTDTPFTSVSVKPVEGWTSEVITGELPRPVTVAGSTVTKAPSAVIWTADAAHQLGANQYQVFSLSVGKLPAAGTTVTLPAAQTYTDGKVVNWDEKTVPGQNEPKHPAPSFVTTAEDRPAAASAPSTVQAAPVSETSDASVSIWGVVFGAAGFVLGAAALVVVLAGRRGRRA